MAKNPYLNSLSQDNTTTYNNHINDNFYPELQGLNDFLRGDISFKTEKGSQLTNISNRQTGMTYNIPQNKLEQFFIHLDSVRKISKIKIHYLERQSADYSGIVIDVDIYQKNKERQLTSQLYSIFISRLMSLILETLNMTPEYPLSSGMGMNAGAATTSSSMENPIIENKVNNNKSDEYTFNDDADGPYHNEETFDDDPDLTENTRGFGKSSMSSFGSIKSLASSASSIKSDKSGKSGTSYDATSIKSAGVSSMGNNSLAGSTGVNSTTTNIRGSIGIVNTIKDSMSNYNKNTNINTVFNSSEDMSPIVDDMLDICCFITEKPEPLYVDEKDCYKDGFHILIPELMVSRVYKKYLIEEILRQNIMERVFKNFTNLLSSPDKMLDKSSSSFPVMFLGNSKIKNGKNCPPYLLKYGYKISCDTISKKIINSAPIPIEQLNSGEIMPEFVNDNANVHSRIKNMKPLKVNLSYELSLSFYLQSVDGEKTWLQKRRYNYLNSLHNTIMDMVTKINNLPDEVIEENNNSISLLCHTDGEAAYVRALLSILMYHGDCSYVTDYDKWYKVLSAIANINKNYKDLAIWFSQAAPEKWSLASFEQKWNDILSYIQQKNAPTYSVRSLIKWAEDVDEIATSEISNQNYSRIIYKDIYQMGGTITDYSCAKVLSKLIQYKYVIIKSALMNKYSCYEFVLPDDKHKKGEVYKWRFEGPDSDKINVFISEKLSRIYLDVLGTIKKSKNTEERAEIRKYLAQLEKKLSKNIEKLYSECAKNSISKQLNRIMSNDYRNFADELDKYPNIRGVGNGILVLGKTPKLIKGFHEYKISKYTPVDYVEYSRNDFYVNDLLRIIGEIFIEPDVCRFMLCYFSMCLDRSSINIYLLQIYGGGANGKTIVLNLLFHTLGKYYGYQAPPELLSDASKKAADANPAFMECKDKLAVFYSELESNTILQESRMKAILSPEEKTGRQLYKEQENFVINALHIIATNYPIGINSTDHGIWRRMLYYNSKMSFVDNPDPNNRYEKKLNKKLDNLHADDNYKRAFLSILVHYNQVMHCVYDYNIDNLLKETPTMLREFEEYRNSQDRLNLFISSMVVISPSEIIVTPATETTPETTTVSPSNVIIDDMAQKYKDWLWSKYNMKKSLEEIVTQLKNSKIKNWKLNEQKLRYITGYRILAYQGEELKMGEKYIFNSNNDTVENEQKVDLYDTWEYNENDIDRVIDDDLKSIEDQVQLTNLSRGNINNKRISAIHTNIPANNHTNILKNNSANISTNISTNISDDIKNLDMNEINKLLLENNENNNEIKNTEEKNNIDSADITDTIDSSDNIDDDSLYSDDSE